MNVWLLSACIRALLCTSSALAACCQPRTMCALPGTEGPVLRKVVSRLWCWNVLVDRGLVEALFLTACIFFYFFFLNR